MSTRLVLFLEGASDSLVFEATIDGQRFELGDVNDVFTLQSSSKPVLYCAALDEHGAEKVHRHVGREPSGLSFKSRRPVANLQRLIKRCRWKRACRNLCRVSIWRPVFRG